MGVAGGIEEIETETVPVQDRSTFTSHGTWFHYQLYSSLGFSEKPLYTDNKFSLLLLIFMLVDLW